MDDEGSFEKLWSIWYSLPPEDQTLVAQCMPYRRELEKCPACGSRSLLVRQLDRYVHIDGSENHDCWLRISRGEVQCPPQ